MTALIALNSKLDHLIAWSAVLLVVILLIQLNTWNKKDKP